MKKIDGPKTPVLFQTLQSVFTPLQTLENFQRQYGDFFQTHVFGFPPTVITGNPQAIKTIFANSNIFDSAKSNEMLSPLIGNQSLLLLDGREHQRHKKLLTPPLHGETLKSYGHKICALTQEAINQWEINQPFKICPFMRKLSLKIIFQLTFGENDSSDILRNLLSEWFETFSSPFTASWFFFPFLQKDFAPWSPWGRFLRLRQQINQIIYQIIQERRQHQNHYSQPQDILSLLLSVQDEEGNLMTDKEVRDELVTMLLAGYETTASALSGALYWVHYLPKVRNRLLQELEENYEPTELAKLPYLTAVCQETLRVYPIALLTTGRILKEHLRMMDYEFVPGTVLLPCIYLLHQREELYPEPQRFQPERFLEKKFSAYEYMPFGGSNRRCLGMAFALFELKLVLGTVLSHWQLELSIHRQLKLIRRGAIMSAPDSLQLLPIKRKQ